MEYNAREILFTDFVSEMAAKYPTSPVVTCEGVTLRYEELRKMADMCSLQLIRAGVKKGDKVALWSYNSMFWMIGFLGIVGAGAVAVLMNYGLRKEDETTLMNRTDCSWLILGPNSISSKSIDEAKTVAVEAGIPRDHILHDSTLLQECFSAKLQDISPEDTALLKSLRSGIDPHDTQVIIFTTGTSSIPKAAQLSSYSMLNGPICFGKTIFPDEETVSSSLLLALPLFHSYGIFIFFFAMSKGSHIHIPTALKPEIMNRMVDDYKIRDMASVCTIYDRMSQLPDFEQRVAGKLRNCYLGGSFESPTKIMRLENVYGGARFGNGYGQTECSPLITLSLLTDSMKKRSTRVGRPLTGLDVRIWNAEKGFLPQGEVGEVVVKGFCQMNGYYGLPDEKQAIDADGWLHTEDLGRFDEDGFLELTGRIKDIIIRCGENISPSEIESVLLSDENILSAKVMGAPHKNWGESVEACIVAKDPEAFDEERMKELLKQKISSFKIPSHFFLYPHFPMMENGKTNVQNLRKDMLQKLALLSTREALQSGVHILCLALQDQSYTVSLVGSLIDGLAMKFQYGAAKIGQIRTEVQELLKTRIQKAYETGGQIRLDVVLMTDWLRFSFTDGIKKKYYKEMEEEYGPETVHASIGTYSVDTEKSEHVEYYLDYAYSSDFDVTDYLLANRNGDAQ